ncbi:DUF4382 domain-containing protein [Proteiniphilum acetatigenes]|uniref:DUF4382 domain-containing protein n=1 Tax=Proteiniphilum acetatigenes TaxID=294710 RepID=UPI00036CE490|nr:DUF4382 domain-containing protein [Proteiniphilum acetatigenes]SFL39635.1 protein of unknown function [Porphyromonadaceae bacterium KH3CP3RA]
MRYRPFRYILLITVLLFSWQACDSEDPSVNASRLRLKLTDATSLVIKEFYVDIREVSVFLVDTTSEEGEWLTLDFSGSRYDILKLRNGKTVQLVDQYVPAGRELQQIKLVFGDDNMLQTNTDSIIPLYIPSELEEGVIIDAVKMEMRLNTISSMVIDLNAALSVVKTEEGDNYLYPVARAFPEVFGGKLRGYVAPLEANPYVKVIQEKDTFLSIPERENLGDQMLMFQFIGLNEGDWEVHFVPDPQANFRDTVVIVTIEQGETFNIPTKPIRLKRLSEE